MRARAIREGSVGLLILIGIGLFGGLVLWLQGLNPGRQNYRATLVFENTLGMQEGTAVRYRGVPVGRVARISPSTNEVEVSVEISDANLLIPSDALIEANQSGLIGETTIDITPLGLLDEQTLTASPVDPECDSQQILCDGDRIQGQVGVSYESLIRSAEDLANAFADEEIVTDVKRTLNNAAALTENANGLVDELIVVSKQLQTDLGPLLASANRATDNLGNAAGQFEITGTEVNDLIAANRSTLVSTLDNLNRSTADLQDIMATLTPQVRDSELLSNLNTLSADAAAAMADLRDITGAANTPENLVMLQQTLESARNVFFSAQKVLADVDELTGDPAFRNNIRNLINGLNTLVSLSDDLSNQSRLAAALTPTQTDTVERVTLTAVPPVLAERMATETNAPLLVSRNGQYYRLDINQPPQSLPAVDPPAVNAPAGE
jgi:phospholipid/cholesterol/gamma-HCH transport system substrate-binding protein